MPGRWPGQGKETIYTVVDNQSQQNPIYGEPEFLRPNGLQIQIQRPQKCQKNNI